MSTKTCTSCGQQIAFARRRPADPKKPKKPWDVLNVVELTDAQKDPDDSTQRLVMDDGTSWPPKAAVKHYTKPTGTTEAENMTTAREYPWYTVHRCRQRAGGR